MQTLNGFPAVGLFVALIASAIPSFSKTPATDGMFPISRLNSSLALADLDGDHHPDLAISEPQGFLQGAYRYRVNVRLSAGDDSSFLIESKDALFGVKLFPMDVDGDQDFDFVITGGFGLQLIGVWLNDGRGNFTYRDTAHIPEFICPHNHPQSDCIWFVKATYCRRRLTHPGASSRAFGQSRPRKQHFVPVPLESHRA
jgi:FG-GAP repeat protein